MRIAIPTTPDRAVDRSWGRASKVTIAQVENGALPEWTEFDVRWDEQHDADGEGAHHARIARFLLDEHVDRVAAHHMGQGMTTMLARMGIEADLGVTGDARAVALQIAAAATPGLNAPDALRSLHATSHEHHGRIMEHVERLPVLADEIATVDIETFARDFEVECRFISTQLVPHIEAIEATLYGELDRLMEHRHSMDPMREEHARLRGLFEALCHYRQAIERGQFEGDEAIGLRRVLFRLYSLLKVHLAEEELYLGVIDRDLSPEEKDILARGIDHAAAQPV